MSLLGVLGSLGIEKVLFYTEGIFAIYSTMVDCYFVMHFWRQYSSAPAFSITASKAFAKDKPIYCFKSENTEE